MLRCFTPQAPTQTPTSSPKPNGTTADQFNPNSPDETLISNPQISTTVNLTTEYTLAVQTNSYNEIWSKIHHHYQAAEHDHDEPQEEAATSEEEVLEREEKSLIVTSSTTHLVSQVLQPNRDLVNEALRTARPSNLTRLVSAYFDHSEHTSRLCFHLHRSIDQARSLYSPLLSLLEILPLDSLLSQPQCDFAFEIFQKFDLLENPFPQPNSDNFHEMRRCFTQLKQQLDRRLIKARKQARLYRTFSLSSFSLFTGSRFPFLSSSFAKRQLHHIAQLDAAAKGTYVLNNDLDTIDRLVTRLHGVVESDKLLIRLGLERGKDRYLIQEVVKQLHKNHPNFLNQLKDLEEHICLCFATVNRARGLLLQEIHLHQTRNS
ncbi:hypothetical protein BVC80_897g7 [Macleaya cordata]|uniref:Uncharacterized protein n=1 Tax=Macleaya cordata TaxID=56857 RepID=A0A200QFR6_MACCD|nr:hypothetical protein BVC80_897g7 [Macleaya cordata]